jgi:putative Mg2+ transporter-C (MgtC) family protein
MGCAVIQLVAAAGAAPKVTSQIVDLALALGLTAVIGFERELREKSAGLRTHAVIGLGAALFVLISKYGFADVLSAQRVVLDPSRVAAQIASGIGFVGAGLIFIRREAVKGLTTAATVWLSAAVGAAAGAGLASAAALATGGYLVVAVLLPLLEHWIPERRSQVVEVVVTYQPGQDALHRVLQVCESRGYVIVSATTDTAAGQAVSTSCVTRLSLRGHGSAVTVLALVSDVSGVDTVTLADEARSGRGPT